MKKLIPCGLFTLVAICTELLYAQPPDTLWTRVYSRLSDQYDVRGAVVTPENGLLVAGMTDSVGGSYNYPLVLKINGNGDSLWSHMLVDSAEESHIAAITSSQSGGYVLTGHVHGTPPLYQDCLVQKIDESGDSEWRRRYSVPHPEEFEDIKQCADNAYIMCGQRRWTTSSVYVAKINSVGDTLWTKEYPFGYEHVWAYSIDIVPSGGFVIGGYLMWSTHDPVEHDAVVIRIDDNGDTLWTTIVGTERVDRGVKVLSTPDDGFLLLGYTEGYTPDSSDFIRAIYLAKLNDQGHVVWDHYLDAGPYWPEPFDIALVGNSGYVIAGFETTWLDQPKHPIILRVDAQGEPLWTIHFREFPWGEAKTVDVMSDGGYIVSGIYNGDFFCSRTEPDAVSTQRNETPSAISMLRVYPNPFNASMQISFSLPVTSRVSLRLYDVLGRETKLLMDEMQTAGEHRMNISGSGLSSGVYLCRMQAGEFSQVKKIVLMK